MVKIVFLCLVGGITWKVAFRFLPARAYRFVLSAFQMRQLLGQLPWPLTYFSWSFRVKMVFSCLVGGITWKVCFRFLPAREYRSILSASQTHQLLGQLPWPLTYFSRSFVVKILFFGHVGRISQDVLLQFSSSLVCWWILTASHMHQPSGGLPWPLTYFSMSFVIKTLFWSHMTLGRRSKVAIDACMRLSISTQEGWKLDKYIMR